jgi:hypothetical protein
VVSIAPNQANGSVLNAIKIETKSGNKKRQWGRASAAGECCVLETNYPLGALATTMFPSSWKGDPS